MKKAVSTILIAVLIAVFCSVAVGAADADFTMTSAALPMSAADILANSTFGENNVKFNRDGHTVCASGDGLYFWHSGAGDSYTFTVDFGSYSVGSLTYKCNRYAVTVGVYADGELVGSAVGNISAGAPECDATVILDKPLTGKHEIKLEILAEKYVKDGMWVDANVWPGSDYGCFTFNAVSASVTASSDSFPVSAADMLKYGSFSETPAAFNRAGNVICPSGDGLYFWHAGAGDAFTFTADFGSYSFGSLSFKCNRSAVRVAVYSDGILAGRGIGNLKGDENGKIIFDKPLTGIRQIKIVFDAERIIKDGAWTDSDTWPGSDCGCFTFNAVSADFTADSMPLTLKTSDILSKGTFDEDIAAFNRAGNIIRASDDGLYFWHAGSGDSFTFTVDFGTKKTDSLTLNCNRNAVGMQVYADGELVGQGICNPDAAAGDTEGKIQLSTVLTGVHVIKLKIVSEQYFDNGSAVNVVNWPGSDIGKLVFNEAAEVPVETDAPETDAPETDAPDVPGNPETNDIMNTALIIAVAVLMLTAAGALVLKHGN